jgi:hypothetical protein
MNNIVLVAIPVSILIINGPIIKSLYSRYKYSNRLPSMRSDICYKQKVDLCPMSSYKQCTNNYLPKSPCKCEERSNELCPVHYKVNDMLYQNNYDPFKKPVIPPYVNGLPRVNVYQSNKTSFDKL